MRADEWFKDRDQAAWIQTKKQALQRDHSTCSYCLLICQKFMQVNHIGAEDRHDLENLETVYGACHRVQQRYEWLYAYGFLHPESGKMIQCKFVLSRTIIGGRVSLLDILVLPW